MKRINKLFASKKGITMIITVCLMALITALSLSLLFSSSLVLSSAKGEFKEQQLRILAVSLSKELEEDITGHIYDSASAEAIDASNSIWFYIKNQISSGAWPYFNEDERGHTPKYAYKYLKFDNNSFETVKNAGVSDVEVLLWWESSSDSSFDNTPLYVVVTVSNSKSSCCIKSEYTLDYTVTNDAVTGGTYEKWVWSLNWRE